MAGINGINPMSTATVDGWLKLVEILKAKQNHGMFISVFSTGDSDRSQLSTVSPFQSG